MLQNYTQFTNSQAVRNQMGLISPVITADDNISIPRESVVHYLDYASADEFPSANLPLLRSIPQEKRIPVHHVTDLIRSVGTTTLANRTLTRTALQWAKNNTDRFKVIDLLAVPNTSAQVNAVYNYQLTKNLYNYKADSLANLNRRRNVYATYWETVHRAIEVGVEDEHFVQIPIPHMLPSKALIDTLLTYPDSSFARVVQDHALGAAIDLYQFLDRKSPQGAMSGITDQDSTRITVQLTFMGYSCFFKLSLLVALSRHSSLVSKRKIETKELHRLMLAMMLKIQQKVYDLQNGTTTELDDNLNAIDELDGDARPDTVNPPTAATKGLVTGLSGRKPLASVGVSAMFDPDTSAEFSSLVDADVTELEGASDEMFIKLMNRAVSTPEPAPDKEPLDGENEEAPTLPQLTPDYSPEKTAELLRTKTIEENFETYHTSAKASGGVSTVEVRSLKKLFDARGSLKSPYDATPIDRYKVVSAQDVAFTEADKAIHIDNDLVDDALKSETLFTMSRLYLKKTLRKDIVACVTHLETAGIIIKDYQVERNDSVLGSYEVHKLTLKPYKGKESTVYFRLPVPNDEGEFTASGVKYRMRRLRTDDPIRKVGPTRVAITSNYAKLFVSRTERKSYDPYAQISDWVRKTYLSGDGVVTKVSPGSCFNNLAEQPPMFMALSRDFNQFTTKDYTFIFNAKDIQSLVKPEVLASMAKMSHNQIVGYRNSDKTLLTMGYDNSIYLYDGSLTRIGTLPELCGIDVDKLPTPFATIKILGDDIPLGVVMAYYLGLNGLLSVTQTEVKVYGPRQQVPPAPKQVVVRLQDCKLAIATDTPVKQLLFGGFAFYKDTLKTIDLADLENQGVYLTLLEQRDATLTHLKELDLLRQLFLDPMTVDVLRDMGEPTEYLPLLLRACSMLSDFSHPDINDPLHSRIRGYDRIPGLMYRTLTRSVRSAKFGMTKGKVELDPYAVWNAITQDTTVKIVEDSNPITNVKETESVTFSGADGLNKSSTPEKLRRYHRNDKHLVSEATVDSSDVALNFFLTPYPKLANLRGKVSDVKSERQDTVFSTSAMLAPMIEHDDPKRINFVNIQNGHTIATAGYEQPALRTGYEYLMPYKVGSLYCVTAPEPGSVVSITDKQLKVKYASGSEKTYRLGATYGRMEGSVYRHNLVTDLKMGQKFKVGEYLTYNDGFFERDWLNPEYLVMKFNKTITVALSMSDEVYEDSSAISKKLSEEMTATVIKEKSFIIEFDKNITDLKNEGDEVDVNDSLFTLTSSETDYSNLSESSIDLLKGIANLSPRARVRGTIFRYEVKYNGELSDMSPTLRKLAQRLDKQTLIETECTDVAISNNRVSSEYRSAGTNLMPGSLELKIFIQHQVAQAHADKGVFASQMKSVISDVMRSTVTTASGTEVDAMFSYRSILNRTALSPLLIGTTNRLLRHVSPMVADAYFS